jgi:anaerobic magnesium-protoporphyrin IX monomethyl ester cyclase
MIEQTPNSSQSSFPRGHRTSPASKGKPLAILVFPPVWLPIVPHLAVPVLTAYLREKGFKVVPVDANLEFFTRYLLTRKTLARLLDQLSFRLNQDPQSLPEELRERAVKRFGLWEQAAHRVEYLQSVLRLEESFFDPDKALPAIEDLYQLMEMASLSGWPGRISFNYYRRGDIWSREDLAQLCTNPLRNVFLPFWKDLMNQRFKKIKPSLVGISISSVHQFIAAMTLARLLREEMPEIHVVVGGKHLLRIQEKLTQHSFFFQDYFHSAVLHEGEEPLAMLMGHLESGEGLESIPGLVYMANNRPRLNPPKPPPALGELPPPDFSDVQWQDYLVPRPYAPLRMSRGCYWGKCTFCIRYGTERVDFMEPHQVVGEMERLGELYGVRDFTVNDDCMPPEYWEELCQEILSRKLKVSMLIWAKPVAGFTAKRLKKMAQAGVRQIRWGVESAHPRVLRLMRKGTTVSQMREVLERSRHAGIWNHACFILGFPTETREEAETTLDFLRSHRDRIHSFILYPFVLYENTHVFANPREFSLEKITRKSTPFFDILEYRTKAGMAPREAAALARKAKETLLEGPEGKPFWYYLKLREYLQLYLDRFGSGRTKAMSFDRRGLEGSWEGLEP